jgi:hypothetical protein
MIQHGELVEPRFVYYLGKHWNVESCAFS